MGGEFVEMGGEVTRAEVGEGAMVGGICTEGEDVAGFGGRG